MKSLGKKLCLVVLGLLICSKAWAVEYQLDSSHSSIWFNVEHLLVSTTRGEFTDFECVIEYDPDNLEAAEIDVLIQVKSIDTRNADRDGHLRSPDFFDVANHPTITFKSTQIKKTGDGHVIVGDLTMRGVTRSISIPAKIAGPIQSPFGFTAIGVSGETTINRQDFGISWNKALDQGGYMVGNDVKITFSIEAHHK